MTFLLIRRKLRDSFYRTRLVRLVVPFFLKKPTVERLVVSGSGAPTSATSLSGKLTVVADANGNQVEYNGHPLYTYSADTGPGQTTGEGVGGVWHVCTPSLT